jgi:hypothetical protein
MYDGFCSEKIGVKAMSRKRKSLKSDDVGTSTVVPEKISPKTRPAAPGFVYLENRVAGLMGVNVRKLARLRASMTPGTDWEKRGSGYWWTREAVQTALKALGVPEALVFPENGGDKLEDAKNAAPAAVAGPWLPAKVVNSNLTNQWLILALIEGVVEKVQVSKDWRDLFRNGMNFEAQKSAAGVWRTRKPKGVGRW